MDILGRTVKILNWILFGNSDPELQANFKNAFHQFVSFLEVASEQAKNIEVVWEGKSITFRYRKEF